MKDFFISYTKADQAWAEWLAWQLEEAGYQTILDRWDFQPGSNFVLSIDQAASQAHRTLAVLSPDYLGALYTQAEWAAAFARDPIGQASSLIPIRVRACDLQGLLRSIVFIDLVGLEERKAVEVLLRGITNSRKKPDKSPKFPGNHAQPPFFPGQGGWRSLGPRYDNEEMRTLAEELGQAYQDKEELLVSGKDVHDVGEKILNIRRRLREGGRLKAGDFLQDDRFRLIEPIGRGGFATVWKALDRKESNIVAVKVLHVDLAHDKTRCERFFRGARKMADLRHQGIVRVIEREIDDGGYRAFVMEYVEGGDFHRAVVSGRLSLADRVRIIQEVGVALQFAHSNGVIHRDVKPANILLTADAQPKLTDFDLVRAFDTTGGTRTGMLGTFLYAAPESMEKAKDSRQLADVYGLGMTLLFALTGTDLGPDAIRNPSNIIKTLMIDREARALLARAVSWDPKLRPANMTEFCSALSKHFLLTADSPAGSALASIEEASESRFRFETFIVGGSNELAWSAARAVAERPFVAYNQLFIYGGSGLGKSHLLRAIVSEIYQEHSHLNVVIQTGEELTNRIIEAIRSDRMQLFREWSRSIEVLLVDDFQFIANKERTQEEIIHIFNSILQRNGQIVLAANSSPRDMPTLEERLRRRLVSGLIVSLGPLESETKVGILRMKSRLEGIDLPEETAAFIAGRCNVGSELDGALNRLFATASLANQALSVEFAESTLDDLFAYRKRPIDVADIIRWVANHYGLKVSEIKSKSNARQVSFPRQVAMYLCKKYSDLSYPEVGRLFNDKHHSTVMYAIQKIEALRKVDPDFDRVMKAFEARGPS